MASVLVVDVGVFIMTHGGVNPNIVPPPYLQQMPVYTPTPSHEYTLTAEQLPEQIRLYAPSILGNVYYDHPNSEGFIHKLHETYMQIQEKPRYIDYLLQAISDFEQKYVDSSEKRLEQESKCTVHDRQFRHLWARAIVHKSRVEWKEHTSRIAEKTYLINPSDIPQNSIMFFCEETPPLFISFQKDGTFITKDGKKIFYSVERKDPMYIIKFVNREYLNILFDDIRNLLLSVLRNIISVQHSIRLSIFDFTCSELIFPTDDRPHGVKPVLLSSDKSRGHLPFLLYGTIGDRRFSEIVSDEHMGRLPLAHHGSLSSSHHDSLLSSHHDSWSSSHHDSLSQSHLLGDRATPSPVSPTALLIVHLLGGVESFADFNESKYDSRAHSVSPPPSIPSSLSSSSQSSSLSSSLQSSSVLSSLSPSPAPPPPPTQYLGVPEKLCGGGRRCVVKKVSRKRMIHRCRRCNSRTKVRSKRSKRRRGTKSKH